MKKNTRYSDNSYNSNKTQSRKSSSLSNLIDYQTSVKNSKPNSNKSKKDIKKKEIKPKDNKFEEDFNYQIDSSSKNTVDLPKSNSKKNINYIDQLESKIQDQAQKLNELTKYKSLCEKRLKQLNPIEELPISEESLTKESSRKISPKRNIKDNYELLYEKYISLLKDYNDLISKSDNSQINDIKNLNNDISDKYVKLKEKYKKLKEDNEKTIELLKEATLATEEQRNIISLLQKTIESDLIKGNVLKKYITFENVIDFAKIKNESEEYRKELVLSQALVNSLKSEIEVLMKEKNQINDNNNINNFLHKEKNRVRTVSPKKKNKTFFKENILNDSNENNSYLKYMKFNSLNDNDILLQEERKQYLSENASLKDKIYSQNTIMNNLYEENSNLKLLLQQVNNKYNERFSTNRINNENINMLQIELKNKKNELLQYEKKIPYFNDYIIQIKQSLDSIKNLIIKYIDTYNFIIKEDSNHIFSGNFIENLKILSSKLNNVSSVEQNDLDFNHDYEIYQLIEDILRIIHDEFITIYEKIFDNNDNYNEINLKIFELEKNLKKNSENIHEKQKEIISLNEQLKNEIEENNKLKKILGKNDNQNLLDNKSLKNQIQKLKKEKNNIINLFNSTIKIIKIKNDQLGKLLEKGISICEEIFKLNGEKDLMLQKLNILKEEDNFTDNNNKEKTIKYNKEYNSILELLNEFDRKIEEKENKLEEVKDELYEIYLKNNNLFRKPQKKNSCLGNNMPLNINHTDRYQRRQNINLDNLSHNSNDNYINKSLNNMTHYGLFNRRNNNLLYQNNSFNGNQIIRNNDLQKSFSQKIYKYIKN